MLTIVALLSSVMVLSIDNVSYAAPSAKKDKTGKLGPHDQELLAAARAKGEPAVTILIAAVPGQSRSVATAVQALGGNIRYEDNDLDYLRVRVATDLAEKVAALPGIDAADLDEIIPIDDPRPEGIAPVAPQTPPGATTPNSNPYMPTRDTRAAAFLAAHPTWDGRGITIGIVDTGVSFDHPSLVTTSTGERKIVDWVTGTDPIDDGDPTWLNMATQVTVAGGSFTSGGATYTHVAADGAYRFALFSEQRLGNFSEYDARALGVPGCNGSDVNRNGVCGERFGVLWRTSDNMVWVDTNADRSFAGATTMTDYKVRFDVGTFGTDNPATAIREAVPFVVQTDGKNKFVNIGIASGAHASHVAGIATGNALFGGAMSGAAPGAKIVSSRACLFVAGCTSHALLEGMIFVAKQANVDVINMSIGGLPALNDGNDVFSLTYNRLIKQTKAQMFISAGNSGPGLNTVGFPSVGTDVVSVGASITAETYLKNYGNGPTEPTHADNLHFFSSRGPREDGGFKPNIVAPGAAVSSIPMWQPGSPVPGTYSLPPGYGMFNGTSMAAPQATGGAALLLSAAKATGVQHQPEQLRQAIYSTARAFDPTRFQAFDQGNGLMNVEAAWNLLRTNIKTVEIKSSVAVSTLLSGFLPTPNVGVGIHDREGVAIGRSYTREYTFRRTSGAGGTITYSLSWVQNDGTFSSAGTLPLPKDVPVKLTVNINPASAGAHSAILNVDDPATAGIDYQTMNVVIAPFELTGTGNFSQTINSDIDIAQARHYFYRVPAGLPALKVDFTGPATTAGTGQARFLRWHPWGLGIESNAVSNCYSPPQPPVGACNRAGGVDQNPNSRTGTSTQGGVWEITVDARRSSDADDAPFALTAAVLGATVSPNPDIIASATIGTPISRSYTLANQFGSFTGRAAGTTLGSARRGPFTIAHLETQQYPLVVTTGSTSLRATIGSPSDPAADLDLFVFSGCSSLGPTCAFRGQSADGDSEESVTIANPEAGDWLVVVDGFDVPSGSTSYSYIDVFANTAFGSVTVTDANALRTVGATWTVPGSVTANAAPAAGRVLYGNVQVVTDGGTVIGQNDVIIQSVTP
jgi:hypothetical protein